MHTEAEIRRAIKPLVELYGELNMTQVKQHIEDVLIFDAEDKEQSSSRNEIKIIQRIGNIVSHQQETTKVYEEGFMVDKTQSPAVFSSIKGLYGKESKIENVEIKNRQQYAEKVNIKERRYRKVNWEMENERRTSLGVLGEEFVFNLEVENIRNFDKGSTNKVIHLSADQGDGFGYDILSINDQGETIYIEVKTTTGPADTPFYMSLNEKEFFEENKNRNAFIYRVYEFNEGQKHGRIEKISAKDLFEKYTFDPITFMVKKK